MDTTIYFCEASNTFGKSIFNVSLTVLEPPDSPGNFHVDHISSHSVMLIWDTPFDGNTPLIGYKLNYKKLIGRFDKTRKHETMLMI